MEIPSKISLDVDCLTGTMLPPVPPAKKKSARKKAAKKKAAAIRKLPNLFCVFGTDEGRVKEVAAKQVRELTPPDAGEFGVEVIEGNADNSDHAAKICGLTVEAIQTLPFFGGDKVIWLKGANFFADNVTGRSELTKGAVENLLYVLTQSTPPSVKVVISASEIDKRRTFFMAMKKAATMELHDLPDVSRAGWEEGVEQLVAQRARERGLRFSAEALEYFVLLAGQHSRQIENELEKLDVYLGERRDVTTDDVRTMVSQSRAGVVFELGDAIGKKDIRLALKLIDQLLYRGESAIGILLAAVVPKTRNLFYAKLVEEQFKLKAFRYNEYQAKLGQLPPAETSWIGRTKEGKISAYPLFLAAREAQGFSLAQLRAGMSACLEANTRLVTSQLDHKTVLCQLVIRIVSGR
ncbi:MAG: DNA polymerase-3 subunit delta [Verrucomicrobiales bacterium]|jgi:DNA polymerase-3 subunit delta